MIETKHIQIGDVEYTSNYFNSDKEVLEYVIKRMKAYEHAKELFDNELSVFFVRDYKVASIKIFGPPSRIKEMKTFLRSDLKDFLGEPPKKTYQKLEEYLDSVVKLKNEVFIEGDLIDFPFGGGKYLSFYRLSEESEYKWSSEFFKEDM